MPAIFDDIELDFKGVTYRLKGDDQIMMALASVEDHLTLTELVRGQQKGSLPLAKLSSAYGCVLRHAGCRVSDAEVYGAMWDGGLDQTAMQNAIFTLMQMMMPTSVVQNADDGEAPGNVESPRKAKKKASSARRGKRG